MGLGLRSLRARLDDDDLLSGYGSSDLILSVPAVCSQGRVTRTHPAAQPE